MHSQMAFSPPYSLNSNDNKLKQEAAREHTHTHTFLGTQLPMAHTRSCNAQQDGMKLTNVGYAVKKSID